MKVGLCDSVDYLYSPWSSPGQNIGVGSLSLPQGIFPNQGSNPGPPHCRWILNQLTHREALILTKVKVKSISRVRPFATRWTVAYQAPLSMEFSRQEYWSGLPFPSPGDLPNPGLESGCPGLQAEALLSEPPRKPTFTKYIAFCELYFFFFFIILHVFITSLTSAYNKISNTSLIPSSDFVTGKT